MSRACGNGACDEGCQGAVQTVAATCPAALADPNNQGMLAACGAIIAQQATADQSCDDAVVATMSQVCGDGSRGCSTDCQAVLATNVAVACPAALTDPANAALLAACG